MSNTWIQHVKQYAINNQVSYKQALQDAKHSYQSTSKIGGSIKSNYVKYLAGHKSIDLKKIKEPSSNLKTKYSQKMDRDYQIQTLLKELNDTKKLILQRAMTGQMLKTLTGKKTYSYLDRGNYNLKDTQNQYDYARQQLETLTGSKYPSSQQLKAELLKLQNKKEKTMKDEDNKKYKNIYDTPTTPLTDPFAGHFKKKKTSVLL